MISLNMFPCSMWLFWMVLSENIRQDSQLVPIDSLLTWRAILQGHNIHNRDHSLWRMLLFISWSFSLLDFLPIVCKLLSKVLTQNPVVLLELLSFFIFAWQHKFECWSPQNLPKADFALSGFLSFSFGRPHSNLSLHFSTVDSVL